MSKSTRARFPRMIRGSVVVQRRRCGTPSCRCADGQHLHEATVLSYSEAVATTRRCWHRGDRQGSRRRRAIPRRPGQARGRGQRRVGNVDLASGRRPTGPVTGFLALLGLARAGFTAPSFAIFTDLLTGWVCAPGRRTITAMIVVADPAGRRAHDAYHRFVRDGVWSTNRLWQALTVHLIARYCPVGAVELACDDTLFHHEGRRVEGAGTFRDAVRSTLGKVVYARGLNLVVITLIIRPPWAGCPIAVPVNVRVHRKHDATTTIGHAAAMMRQIAGWLPDRSFHLNADGAYATLAGAGLPRTRLTSRMRRDAALYQAAPPRTGKRGRPRTKGDRLPTPAQLSQATTLQGLEQDRGRRARHARHQAGPRPRRALVPGQQDRPGHPDDRARSRRHPAR